MRSLVRFLPLATVVLLVAAGSSGCAMFRGSGVPSDPVERLRYDIDRVLADSVFASTVPSVRVVVPSTGEVLYDRNSHLLIRPASNMKLLTTAAGLHVLSPRYAFKTSVAFDTLLADGTVKGNLYLKGYGDPDLRTADIESLAVGVARLGIRRVTGSVLGDAAFFDSLQWGIGWMWDDEPAAYQAYVSALGVNKNCVHVSVYPDSIGHTGVIARMSPATGYVSLVNRARLVPDSAVVPLTISRPSSEPPNTIVVDGEMAVSDEPREEDITVLRPDRYAAYLLKEALQQQGISVAGPPGDGSLPSGLPERVWHTREMDSMVVNLNKVSDNLSAEMTLKTLSSTVFSPPGSARMGVSVVNRVLAGMGIDTTNHWMVDGSGLSHYNLIRVDLITDLLSAMYHRADLFPLYYLSLPIGGVDGTLENRMKATRAEGNVHAKTGSISGVSSLSGYVTDRDGDILVFGMTMQDFILPSRYYRRAQDRICELLAEFTRDRSLVSRKDTR